MRARFSCLLGIFVGCAPAEEDDAFTVRVVDLGQFPFCSASDPRLFDDLSWLFQAKYRLEFEPGTYGVEASGRIPYRIQVRDVVPSAGTAMLVVDEDPQEAEYDHESDLLYGVSGGEFVIDGESDMFLGGSLGPWTQCSRPNAPVERIDVQLEDGEVSFEVRHVPRDAGLMTSAEGTVEGHPIAVTAYDQLTYSVLPIYAVQFDEPWPDGECALYIQPPEAWLLDCESNKLREIAVLDFEVTAPEP